MEKSFVSRSPAETEAVASSLVVDGTLEKGDFVALYGDLGAGKTVFVRGLAKGVHARFGGINAAEDVLSPTFSLINVYNSSLPLIHCDFYRIKSEDDLYMTGFFDLDRENSLTAVEWSENVPFAVPEDALFVKITGAGDERKIEISRKDEG